MKTENSKRKFNWNTIIAISLAILFILLVVACILLCAFIPSNIMSSYQIISLALSAYGSFSLVLLVVQMVVSKKDAQARHDEKRREKTVDYMIKWSESLRWETTVALKIVEGFNHNQSQKLYNGQPFEVDKKTKERLCTICPRYLKASCKKCLETHLQPKCNDTSECTKCSDETLQNQQNQNEIFLVDESQCAEIRWYIIKYLNTLETILISWKEGIVDREIIKEQFYYLYNPENGSDTLQAFRNVAGNGKSYPTIEEFCLELRNSRQQTNIKLKNIL